MPPCYQTLQTILYTWYQQNKRDLPWRNTHDPYAIWVSEIMLQQTRVETVIDYWHRFMQTFPTLARLAQASEEDVLHIWQGLGYYRRAKLMHKAARQISQEHQGALPTTKDELIKLAGFGPYTAGAVASIAFGAQVPCVDGNVSRVLSRIFTTHENVNPHAQKLAVHKDPSSINQSLMELGATICLPKTPKCSHCPVQKQCSACKQQNAQAYPAPRQKPKVTNIYACALILQDPAKQTFLLQQRPSHGRWANMWEFPYFEFTTPQTNTQAFLQENFPTAEDLIPRGKIKHILTHQSITVDVYTASTTANSPLPPSIVWTKNISSHPTSVLAKKIFTQI